MRSAGASVYALRRAAGAPCYAFAARRWPRSFDPIFYWLPPEEFSPPYDCSYADGFHYFADASAIRRRRRDISHAADLFLQLPITMPSSSIFI
jgi:hypothetical protein